MAHQYTSVGAHVLMASAVLFLGVAGWSAATPAPGKPLHASAATVTTDAPVIAPVMVREVAPEAELPSLATLQPMPALENVAINISVPTARQPEPPKQAVARARPRKTVAPTPVVAHPALPKASEPGLIRVAEAGSRA